MNYGIINHGSKTNNSRSNYTQYLNFWNQRIAKGILKKVKGGSRASEQSRLNLQVQNKIFITFMFLKFLKFKEKSVI